MLKTVSCVNHLENFKFPTVQSRIGDTGTEKLLTTTTLNADVTPITSTNESVSYTDAITESITGTSKQSESTNSVETTSTPIETTSEINCVSNIVKVLFESIEFLVKP